jgi:hypothetical protein
MSNESDEAGKGSGGRIAHYFGSARNSISAADVATLIGVIFVVLIFALVISMARGSGLERLANTDYARGVITLLVVLAFVVLGVLLLIAAMFAAPTGDKDEQESRYRRAREVFMSIVGIVGTIVGFYFGAAGNGQSAIEIQTVPVKEDGKLVARFSGGFRPYLATLKSASKLIDMGSGDGLLYQDVCKLGVAPKELADLEVTDSKGSRSSVRLDLSQLSCAAASPLATPAKPAASAASAAKPA